MAVPYCMREVSEPRRDRLEIVAAVAAAVILVACALSSVPYVNQTTPAARATRTREQDRQSVVQLQTTTHQLQTRNEAVEAQLTKITRLLEGTRSDVAKLTEGHGTLGTQVATTTAKLQQLDTTVRQTSERLAKFSESDAVKKVTKERDDAVTHSQESDNQVRQLTLKLQKAGVYP
jgi:chromosome segregation ATPase